MRTDWIISISTHKTDFDEFVLKLKINFCFLKKLERFTPYFGKNAYR